MRREIRQIGKFDPAEHSARSGLCCPPEEAVTQQHFADEVDVNTIVRRYGFEGAPRVPVEGLYGDFTGLHDFESAATKVQAARDSFMRLEPEVRERFRNDPLVFLDSIKGMEVEDVEAFVRPRNAVSASGQPSGEGVSPPGGDSGGPGAGSGSGDGGAPAG